MSDLLLPRQESIKLNEDTEGKIDVYIKDYKEFSKWFKNVQPSSKVHLADKFSKEVQIDGKVISIENLMEVISFTYEQAQQLIKPYAKLKVFNQDYGITLTLQNQKQDEINWTQCNIIEFKLTKNNVIWGGGVCLGKSFSEICHKKSGIYGTPDQFTGTILFGTNYDNTNAIYTDKKLGDKLTLTFDSYGLHGIEYKISTFE